MLLYIHTTHVSKCILRYIPKYLYHVTSRLLQSRHCSRNILQSICFIFVKNFLSRVSQHGFPYLKRDLPTIYIFMTNLLTRMNYVGIEMFR